MATHSSLTGAELHEPKAIAAAAKGEVYVANGAGSGGMRLPMGDNNVVINSLSDFPTPSVGFHQLAADTNYIIAASITTADAFKFGSNTTLTALSALSPLLTYSGAGDMFIGLDVNGSVHDIRCTCPNANLFNFSESASGGTKTFTADRVAAVACLTFGTFDKMSAQLLSLCTAISCTNGVAVLGTVSAGTLIETCGFFSTSTTYIGVDLTGSTSSSVSIEGCVFAGGAGSIGLKGDGNSNISADNIGRISENSFAGVTTPLSGLSIDDFRWDYKANGDVADTKADALLAFVGNTTETVLAVGVPTLVAGTYILERNSHFTITAAGRATYDGERDLVVPIDVSIVVEPASGTNKSLRAFIALNGTVVVNSGIAVNISSGDPKQLSVPWQLNLTTGDFIEIFIENETDSVNATVVDCTIRVR